MIICICNRINESAVRAAARGGAASPDAVYAAHGCAMKCGRCVCAMKDILTDMHGAAGAAPIRALAAE